MRPLSYVDAPIFEGIREEEIASLCKCLQARRQIYKKEDVIFHTGDTVREIGLVESGGVYIAVYFYWGSRHIFGHIGPGDVFAENYAAVPGKRLLCDVIASKDTSVLFLNLQRLLTTCATACCFHHRLMQNVLRISAQKNLALSSRMMHIAPRTIRERLLSYLSEQAAAHGSPHFQIPFDRQQLANYLGVDRSALSDALGKMQREGLLSFRKNEFTLLDGASS